MDVLDVEVIYPSSRNGWADPGEVQLRVNNTPLAELLERRWDLAGLRPADLPPNSHLLGLPSGDLSLEGRAALLVCPLCGDLGCGAILARVSVRDDTVTWDDFIYGNTYDPEADVHIEARFVLIVPSTKLRSNARDRAERGFCFEAGATAAFRRSCALVVMEDDVAHGIRRDNP